MEIKIETFPSILIPKSALPTFLLQLLLSLLRPPPLSLSLPLYPIPLSLQRQRLPPPDLLLCSPHSLLRRNINHNPDLDPDLDLVVNAPEAALPLDLFLPLLWGDLNLYPDLVLALQEYPLIPL